MGENSYTEESIDKGGYHQSFITGRVDSSSSHEKKLAVSYAVERTHLNKDMAASLYKYTYKQCLSDLGELESALKPVDQHHQQVELLSRKLGIKAFDAGAGAPITTH
jgi:hypothetical protein